MKKKHDSDGPDLISSSVFKILRIMKLMMVLICFIGLLSSFGKSYSQNTKLSVEFKNSSIESVLNYIESRTEYSFMYDNKKIDISREVNISAKDQTVEAILDQLFENEVNYKMIGKHIIITPIEEQLSIASAQQLKSISGKVTDSSGAPLPGVSVVVKGTNTGVITDMDGKYIILKVPDNATLQFSFVGMKTQEVAVGGKTGINITLTEESVGIDEVVAIGYGTQKRGNLTGSIATVKSDDLVKTPNASTTNTLVGRLPGLVSLQSSGQPGFDAAALSIRGFGNALVIVDGVEANFNTIDPNTIESISILKDGTASIYGSRAGNGVILVTTKRGEYQKPTLTLNSSYSLQGITAMPKPSSAGQYAEMKSEEWLQSGKPASNVPYTSEQIQKYYDATDPLYPNTNWYNVLVRDWAPQQMHNLSVRGGSEKVKYYGLIGYLDQQTMWKKNGGDYQRYNFQSNVDAQISDNLSLQVNVSSIFESRKFPQRSQKAGANSIWQDFWYTLPIYPATLPDPTKISYAGTVAGVNAISNSAIAGYDNSETQDLKGTIVMNYSFKSIKGLSAKAFVNIAQSYYTTKTFVKPVNYYTYDPESNIYTLAASINSKASLDEGYTQNRNITGQFSFNYDNTFAQDHHITALVLHEVIDYSNKWFNAGRINFLTPAIDQLFAGSTSGMTNNGGATEMGRKSYVGRLNYSFKNKYLLESTFRADASAKFAPGKQWGYFPSVSLGWVLSEENFMKSSKNIDNLKLRVSYGKSGYDNVGNFQYLSGYKLGETYILGDGVQPGIISTGLANAYLTWEKINIKNVGVDFSMWERKLYGELDAFYRENKGIPATRAISLPTTFGAALPPENINSINNRGFELKLGTSGKLKNVVWDLTGNISWTRSKWDHFEESVYTDLDQSRIYKKSGKWIDRTFGYLSEGLFTSQTQIDNLGFDQDKQGNISLRPGDIRYKDVNKDGVLDWKDQVEIGKGTTPNWMFGVNTSIKYKNFDLSVLFQGALGFYNSISLMHGELYPAIVYEQRWTDHNNNSYDLIPRLGGASTNSLTSDFYYKKADYLRLKEFTLGYTLPKRLLQKAKLNQVRLYFAANNLLTLSKLNKYDIDPESPSGNGGYYYPQQRTLTLGSNISF